MYATAAVTVLLVAAVFASNAAPTDIGELVEYATDDYAEGVQAPRLFGSNTTKDPASSDFTTTTHEDPPASSDSPTKKSDDGTAEKVAVNDLTASAEAEKKKGAPKTNSSVKPNVWDVISEDGCTTLLGIVGHHVPALESSLLELTGLVIQQPVHQRRLLRKALAPIWELVIFMRSVHKATRDYIGAQSFGAQSFTAPADSSDSSSSAELHISLPDAVVIIEDTLRHTTLPGEAAVDVVENILLSLQSLKNYAVLHKVEKEMELMHEQQTAGGLHNFPGFISINAADAAAAAAAVGREKRDGDVG